MYVSLYVKNSSGVHFNRHSMGLSLWWVLFLCDWTCWGVQIINSRDQFKLLTCQPWFGTEMHRSEFLVSGLTGHTRVRSHCCVWKSGKQRWIECGGWEDCNAEKALCVC